jgi:amino acid transporter
VFTGKLGYVTMTIAALLAFITTANAGILSASRYPLALSRDRLLPGGISQLHQRFQTPMLSIGITGVFIMLALFLPLETLVKVASTVVLMSYVLSNLSVIILRESQIQNYQPSFHAPWYPWLQLLGIFIFGSLIIDMGRATAEISISLLVIGMSMYFFYGRKTVHQDYALLHVLERITNKQLTSESLEAELREILQQRDEVLRDPFDHLIASAPVIDVQRCREQEAMFTEIAERLTHEIPLDAQQILLLLQARERDSSTAITPFTAIPHIIIPGEQVFKILIVRCHAGVQFSEDAPAVKAIFVIIGTPDERRSHLKALAAIAQIIQHKDFEARWLQAKNEHQLRDILLLSDRKRSRD